MVNQDSVVSPVVCRLAICSVILTALLRTRLGFLRAGHEKFLKLTDSTLEHQQCRSLLAIVHLPNRLKFEIRS